MSSTTSSGGQTSPLISVVALSSAFCLGYAIYQWKHPQIIIKSTTGKIKKKKLINPPWATKKDGELTGGEIDLEALNKRKPFDLWNTAIFFPDLMRRRQDAPTRRLKQYLREARTSLHVCVYLCSLYEISDIIRDKYRDGLVVKIISDYDTWTAHNNCGLKSLVQEGIPIRLNCNGYLMHNKFTIVDEEAVITGSLNWTRQGIQTNNENVLITTDPRITSKYVVGFNTLWGTCKDVAEIK